jgi:hypothetical protein
LEALREAIQPSCNRIRIEGGLPPPGETSEARHFTSDDLVHTPEGKRLLDEMRLKSATHAADVKQPKSS